jgi:hypothetical protein
MFDCFTHELQVFAKERLLMTEQKYDAAIYAAQPILRQCGPDRLSSSCRIIQHVDEMTSPLRYCVLL